MDMDDFLFMCAVMDDIIDDENDKDIDWVEDFGYDEEEEDDEDTF